MCVVSMVMDHYKPWVPSITTPGVMPWEVPPHTDSEPKIDLAKLFKDMREAVEAAKKVDELTGQPDCVDPEKQKLEQRIKELEELLNKKPEFVIAEGTNLEKGTYRVIDGKLYKCV